MNEQGPETQAGTSVRPPHLLERLLCRARLAGIVLVIGFGIGGSFPNVLKAADSPPSETQPKSPPLFNRHVVPILSRLGCNAGGSCHGVVKGQGGFRLSLFGGQPEVDFERLTREFGTRRLDVHQPDRSLILLKATGQVPHVGGKRTNIGSTDYQVLRDWIAAGSPFDDMAQSRVTRLVVSPAAPILKVGESCRFQVTASYADGTTMDVTNLCRHETHNAEVATIDASGTVRARRVGDTVAVIRYGADPILANLLIVPGQAKKPFPEIKAHNFIDEHILAKLRAMDLPPAAVCDDATFLRRLYLDVTGYLPPGEEVRAFLADKTAGKRIKKIDEVLAKPWHAEIWAAKFSDLIKPVEKGNDGGNNMLPGQLLRIRFYEWLRARLQENVPYDQLVERIFVSSSAEGRSLEQRNAEVKALDSEVIKVTEKEALAREKQKLEQDKKELAKNEAELAKKKQELTKNEAELAKKIALLEEEDLSKPLLSVYNQRRTLDLYWERDGATGITGAIQFGHAFLGLRLQCAQCHRHPYDVWQQDDLLSFANFFTAMSTTPGQVKPLTSGAVETVRVTSPLGTQEAKAARLLGEKTVVEMAADQDRRKWVMEWLRRPDNPFFARAIVNRVWAHYLGRGLVDPPDNLSPLNPPSHPKLLDDLCQGFIKSGYDLRWLHRTILQSRTYQQSSQANSKDQHNYARFQLRHLPGEVILDMVNQAAGVKESYPSGWMFRKGERAILTAGIMVDVYNFYTYKDPFRYLVFGRQLRRTNVQCDCEQGRDVTLPQLLFLGNHEEVRRKIASNDGRVAQLVSNNKLDDQQRLEELFLGALGRLPSAEDLKTGLEYLKSSNILRQGLEEVLWSLVNTREFQLNY